MFGKDLQQLFKQNFAEQFEPYGEGRFVYRKSQKGAPIPVTSEERDRFIEVYARRIRYILWGMTAALLIFVVGIFWWIPDRNPYFANVLPGLSFGAFFFVNLGLTLWAYGAPASELRERSPVGPARSRVERRALYFKRISYTQLAASALAGGACFAISFMRYGGGSLGWFWLVFGGTIVLLVTVQAFRKWCFEREHRKGFF